MCLKREMKRQSVHCGHAARVFRFFLMQKPIAIAFLAFLNNFNRHNLGSIVQEIQSSVVITADSAKYVRPMESASINTYTTGVQGHWMMVHRIAFSPNGKQLAAMIESEDGESIQIRLYGVGGPLKRIAEFGNAQRDMPRRNGEYAGQSNMLAAWNGFPYYPYEK